MIAGEQLTVTLRGKAVATLAPIAGTRTERFEPIAFGLWRKRGGKESVQAWLDRIRSPRYRR